MERCCALSRRVEGVIIITIAKLQGNIWYCSVPAVFPRNPIMQWNVEYQHMSIGTKSKITERVKRLFENAQCWICGYGQILDKYWTSIGQVFDMYWINIG